MYHLLVIISLVFAGAFSPSDPAASPWYVSTNGRDTNDCRSPATACRTIGAAIGKVDAVLGDTIYIAAGVYTESLVIGKDVQMFGDSSGTIIDGGGTNRVLQINAGKVSLTNMTIRNGLTREPDRPGAGIYNAGELSLNNSVVSNNDSWWTCGGIYNGNTLRLDRSRVTENSSLEEGGGICNRGSAVITSSTISGNSAARHWSGGIDNHGSLEVVASTISNNVSTGGGGGLTNWSNATVTSSTISGNSTEKGAGGGIANAGPLAVISSTVANNVALGNGGGIFSYSGIITMRNALLAGNRVDGGQGPDCFGPITAEGYNLVQNPASCGVQGDPARLLGVDPRIGPLQNNGGASSTHALPAGSPAIDAAPDSGCPASDQRGVDRPLDGNADLRAVCDLGAFEYEAIPAAPTNLTAVAASTTSIRVTWNHNTANLAGFVLEYSLDRASWIPVEPFPPDQKGSLFTGLTPRKTYNFRVKAIGPGGTASPYSNIASATTRAPRAYTLHLPFMGR